ncbi:PD-(D/E)XK nuclease family protein [Ktedonospora formicarum]|uniref:PD-(D/E)XK endonuclease-like domain-containing protein n=1 Tax=Ktedonospora formicarum TaxID=2778364 RepID=A0A8J3MQQ5_9CHLR|nr:PD-(D/E)XK nuclease family protein [Ktedonospora formicarum]GHO45147.1 hypothetical protein KSX_33100 [Ktedonospora formicarum]
MAYKGIQCDRARKLHRVSMTREECNECVQDPAHPCPFNAKMLAMMWGDGDHEPNLQTFSPTRLMGCPRAKYLDAHKYSQYLDPYKKWNALRGTMAHGFFENAPLAPGVEFEITEERLETIIYTAFGPQKFVGKPDLVEVLYVDETKVVVKLTDWKSTKEVSHDFTEAKEDHQKQVNMYAYLLARTLPEYLGRPNLQVIVDELEIVYFDMGKVRRFNSKCSLIDRGKLLTPRSAGRYAELELMQIQHKDMEFMHDFIATLIEDAIEARDNLAPAYEGDKARLCPYCPFQIECVALAMEGR